MDTTSKVILSSSEDNINASINKQNRTTEEKENKLLVWNETW